MWLASSFDNGTAQVYQTYTPSPIKPMMHIVTDTGLFFSVSSSLSPPKNPSSANLLAEYAIRYGCGIRPAGKKYNGKYFDV